MRNMGIPKTSDHIQIKIKIPSPNKDPPASSKAPNQELEDRYVLYIFKIKIASQNSKTSDHIQINIKMPNLSQEPPASSKAPNQELKDMNVVLTFKSR